MNAPKARLRLAAALAVVASFMMALPVAAGGPSREPLVYPTFTIEGACDFAVLVEPVDTNVVSKIFTDAEGNVQRQITTGKTVLRLTNEASGKSIVVRVSGPVTVKPTADGEHWVQRGIGLWWAFPGEPSGPDLWLAVGRVEIDFDANFALLAIQRNSRDQPLCPALAG